jgi:hypothetical protein
LVEVHFGLVSVLWLGVLYRRARIAAGVVLSFSTVLIGVVSSDASGIIYVREAMAGAMWVSMIGAAVSERASEDKVSHLDVSYLLPFKRGFLLC